MGFKQLFKVRKPGHGETFEKRVAAASAESKSKKFPSKDNSQNSTDKNPVKK